jgi:hypothetical protein
VFPHGSAVLTSKLSHACEIIRIGHVEDAASWASQLPASFFAYHGYQLRLKLDLTTPDPDATPHNVIHMWRPWPA